MDRHDARDFDKALRQAADLDRRLAGEDPETNYVEDACHWEVVYRELHAFKLQVLNTAEERGSEVPTDGQQEVRNDLTILRAEADRLRRRLEYWTRRRKQLESRAG